MTPEELKKINEIAGEELDNTSSKEKRIFIDCFRGSRDDGDSIEEAIDYALEVYKDETVNEDKIGEAIEEVLEKIEEIGEVYNREYIRLGSEGDLEQRSELQKLVKMHWEYKREIKDYKGER